MVGPIGMAGIVGSVRSQKGGSKMAKSTRVIGKLVLDWGRSSWIQHPGISHKFNTLYWEDGVHLSGPEIDIWLGEVKVTLDN